MDKWIERTFETEVAPRVFPMLVERLRGTPLRLRARVAGVGEDKAKARSGEEWSIQEHAGHLWDLEELWMTRFHEFLDGAATLTAADMSNAKTYGANHNNREMEQILTAFANKRATMITLLESLDDREVQLVSRHPRLHIDMTLGGLALFVAEHDDHHLARIDQLIKTD